MAILRWLSMVCMLLAFQAGSISCQMNMTTNETMVWMNTTSNATMNGTVGAVLAGLSLNYTSDPTLGTTVTTRLVGPAAGCKASFGTPSGAGLSVIATTAANGTFMWNQTDTGLIELTLESTCVDAFTGLPLPFTLRGLANKMGHVAITPAMLLAAALAKANPQVDNSMFTSTMIAETSATAYSMIGAEAIGASSTLPLGVVDPLETLRTHAPTSPDDSATALSAYAADVKLVGLLSIGGSYLATVGGTTVDQAANAITAAIDFNEGCNTTDPTDVTKTLVKAAAVLAVDVSTTRSPGTAGVAMMIAGLNEVLDSQVEEATVAKMQAGPMSTQAGHSSVDIAGLVLRMATISAAQQTAFAAVAMDVAKQNSIIPVTSLFGLENQDAVMALLQKVKVNYGAILAFFGLPNSPTTMATVSAIGNIINCPVALDNFLGPNQTSGTTNVKGGVLFANIAPSLIRAGPDGMNGTGACLDAITNTKINFALVQPLASIPGASVTPISALALAVIAAHRQALTSTTNFTVSPLQIPEAQDLALPEFSATVFTTCYEIMGFNESALAVNFTSMAGTKLQTGQAVRVATVAASGQLLGLVSIGTSFISGMKMGPSPALAAKQFLRATVNSAVADLAKTQTPLANLTAKEAIKAIFLDALKGAYMERQYIRAQNASMAAAPMPMPKRKLQQLAASSASGGVTDPFTDGTFNMDQITALTLVVDALSTTMADTNTRLQTTQTAALQADSSGATNFDLVAALVSIASVSSVQQNDISMAVAALAAIASDPAQAANINSTLAAFSTNFSGANLDAKVKAAAGTLNMAEITVLATPPPSATTPAMKKKKKSNMAMKIGVGVGVGVGGGLLILGIVGYVLYKRRGAQTVVSGSHNA